MTQFAIGRYGADDIRLVKYDGTETDIATWTHWPTYEEVLNGLADFHGIGSSPFNSRTGMVEGYILTTEWPLPQRDLTLADETLPWESS